MKLSVVEKMVECYQRGEAMPLKGHARIEFADAITGKLKDVVEEDNLITNAVAQILAKNWSALANFNSLLPLKSMYSGALIFQNAMTESADNINPPNDLVNPMVAHAGDAMNDTQSMLRGNPIFSDFIEQDTSIKQVWGWDASHGNGTWGCICLCAGSRLGNMGLKPFDATINPLSTFGNDSTNNASWNLDISKQYPMSISSDGQTAKTIWIEDATFTEYTVRHDYFKHGIMRGSRDWQDVSNRSATIRTGANRFVFEDDSYYYIARATGSTTMQIDKVSKSDFTVTQADCTFSGVTLYTGTINPYKNGNFKPFAFDGTYLYFPNGDKTQFLKLNISNNSDVLVLDGTVTIETTNASDSNYQFQEPLAINSGLILGGNYIINGGVSYPIRHVYGIGGANTYLAGNHWLWLERHGAACYGNAKQTYGTSSSQWSGQSNVLCEMFLSSINNLAEPKVKSTSVTARLEYTLTEAT